jgi:hypothetical protein
MTFSSNFADFLFNLTDDESFEKLALEVFHHQYQQIAAYRKYCDLIGKTKPKNIKEIPFLPIEFFKSKSLIADPQKAQIVFKSSGTGNSGRSQHFVQDATLYQAVSKRIFEQKFGPLQEKVILALLPNYQEQGNSSLVYMVDHFIKESREKYSGFFLNDNQGLLNTIKKSLDSRKEVFLFGVSYALLDLAALNCNLQGVHVIETGGMKGRRKEMPKLELQKTLLQELHLDDIYSEYGMTELLSQSYASHDQPFLCPPWMKVLLREQNDPWTWLESDSPKAGGISIIDLANVYSCSFIHTQDLGQFYRNGFVLRGRFDHSDIRGCNQLVYS